MAKTSLRYDKITFEANIKNFLDNLKIFPKNLENFYLAFVHRSVLNESSNFYNESNERLEFLGDAVLELTITEKLFHDFPNKTEWELTDIRSAIVRGRNLANIASGLWVSDCIQLSRGEFRVEWHKNPYILANTMEAILGAIYLEFGFDFVKNWIEKNIYSTLDEIVERWLYIDPKSYLQELTQDVWGQLPVYEVADSSGQDHNKIYKICVSLGDCVLWEWKWTSKKKWEQDAAENAIENRKNWENQVSLPKKNHQ